MTYDIRKTDGTSLVTISDGTINTTTTSLALPGRNFAGYGIYHDRNFVQLTENFAAGTPPPYSLKGQIWYDTGNVALRVCPSDGAAASAWPTITTTLSGVTTTFGNVQIDGWSNIAGNLNVLGNANIFGNTTLSNVHATGNLIVDGWSNLAGNVKIGAGTTTTAGLNITPGYPASGYVGIYTTGVSPSTTNYSAVIKQDSSELNFNAGGNIYNKIGNTTVTTLATGGLTINTGGLTVTSGLNLQANVITTGSNVTPGTITGNLTLTAGSRLNATYADLAERFESDSFYDSGTVVELGGSREITSVVDDLSENVFGVVSSSAAYLMNSGAGDDTSHPAVALSGRLQVKVIGKVKKGDRLVSAGRGKARAAKSGEATAFNTIGRALAAKNDDSVGTVEAIVNIR